MTKEENDIEFHEAAGFLKQEKLNEAFQAAFDYCEDTDGCPECGTFVDQSNAAKGSTEVVRGQEHHDHCVLSRILSAWIAFEGE